jgi:hypothetical protein
MENYKQSSVEWLVDELLDGKPLMPSLIEQAKEMHKQEMKQCADVFELDGFQKCFLNSNPYEHNKHKSIDFEQYYNETYGSKDDIDNTAV